MTVRGVVTRSIGLFVAPFGDGALVYDLVTETAHRLGPVAGWLLTVAESVSLDVLVAEMEASVPDVSPHEAASYLERAVTELRALGLLDRSTETDRPSEWPGSPLPGGGRPVGAAHPVIDHRIAFRSSDTGLLAEIDQFLGVTIPGPPTVVLDVEPGPGGAVVLNAANEWRFPSRRAFFGQLVDAVNEYAARSHSLPVLHSGGVRTPDGRVLLLPGHMDAGKSTLTAALIRAGCDYLGDESIGIRHDTLAAVAYPKPLSLDATSRKLLGLDDTDFPHTAASELRSDVAQLVGDIGRIDEVVLPVYSPDAPPDRNRLDPPEAIKALLTNTLNLARSGESGLSTLCQLARTGPCHPRRPQRIGLTRPRPGRCWRRAYLTGRRMHWPATPVFGRHWGVLLGTLAGRRDVAYHEVRSTGESAVEQHARGAGVQHGQAN